MLDSSATEARVSATFRGTTSRIGASLARASRPTIASDRPMGRSERPAELDSTRAVIDPQ
jgi:hypothetical protein